MKLNFDISKERLSFLYKFGFYDTINILDKQPNGSITFLQLAKMLAI